MGRSKKKSKEKRSREEGMKTRSRMKRMKNRKTWRETYVGLKKLREKKKGVIAVAMRLKPHVFI